MYINSPGGSVTAGLAIYDTMQFVTCDVATYCIGQAASMGAVLLAAGAKGKRRALPNARIMIHQPLAGMEGTAEEIMIHAKEFKNVKHKLNTILLKHTGHPLEKIEEDTDRDRFMSAQEALDYKLLDEVIDNAQAMAEVFVTRGFDVVSGGTDNHLMLVSLIKQGLTGKAADAALGAAHITVNKNAVPNDPQSPFVTSGIRIGTPAVTTRGFKQGECRTLAGWICDILDELDNPAVIERVRGQVAELCATFPVYAD